MTILLQPGYFLINTRKRVVSVKIKELAEKYKDYVIEQRRFFHTIPELSLKEENTTKALAEELKK